MSKKQDKTHQKLKEFLEEVNEIETKYGMYLYGSDYELEVKCKFSDASIAYLAQPEVIFDNSRIIIDDDGYATHLEYANEEEHE
jgi:hypothetical protein